MCLILFTLRLYLDSCIPFTLLPWGFALMGRLRYALPLLYTFTLIVNDDLMVQCNNG